METIHKLSRNFIFHWTEFDNVLRSYVQAIFFRIARWCIETINLESEKRSYLREAWQQGVRGSFKCDTGLKTSEPLPQSNVLLPYFPTIFHTLTLASSQESLISIIRKTRSFWTSILCKSAATY